MVRVPTPTEEDRRRLSRERKVLMKEKVSHVNRIMGLLFGQEISGYKPVNRDRRKALEMLATGDGRPLTIHLKQQIGRELDRLEVVLEQIKVVEAERDAMMVTEQAVSPVLHWMAASSICALNAPPEFQRGLPNYLSE